MLNNYYKILEIDKSANLYEIKKAYRKKVKLYHPDVSKFENSHELFVKVNEAYRCLTNLKPGKTKSNSVSYEDWIKYRREKARKEADKHARARYQEFKKSKIYKTAKVFVQVVNYIYMLIGLIMIIVPITMTITRKIDPDAYATTITATIIVSLLGFIFIFAIFSTRKSIEF